MSLFIEANLRQRARAGTPLNKSLGTVLQERVKIAASTTQFDIFLSHSFNDQELILGIMMSLEDLGYKVYVDWVHDGELNRERVSPLTAALLRIRMEMSKCLFYATTANSSNSKWMPWELGYMDGHNSKAAILPVAQYATAAYTGQEYLGIYPYVQKDLQANTTTERLWIHKDPNTYVNFDSWLTGSQPFAR